METNSETWKEKYRNCSECGKPLPEHLFQYAVERMEETQCRPGCWLEVKKRQLGVCPEAKPINCVCTYAFSCDCHGTRHFGTHD